MEWICLLISFLWLIRAFIEKLMMQSPSEIFYNLNFLWIRVSLLKREYFLYSKVSPVCSIILLIMLSALSSPQRWIRFALVASTALVHAHPRSPSTIIWISSITATSYYSFRGAASIVQLSKLEFLYYFYCPVISEQFTSFCWYSQASSLNGAI